MINTKGNVGDIGDDLKAVIKYMDTGVASTEYTKALDAEVESVKSDEKSEDAVYVADGSLCPSEKP